MSHIGIKYSEKIDVNISESTKNIQLSEKSKQVIKDYTSTNMFAEEFDCDLILQTNDSLIVGFDFISNGKKLVIPEINPVTIYYANAKMSSIKIKEYKKKLISYSQKGKLNSHVFGDYFQLSFNCIINLQSAIETFANKIIQENNYVIIDEKTRKPKKANIHDKINALAIINSKEFESEYNDEYQDIKNLILIRNQMIHLKPEKQITNTKYKIPYRKILEFNFDKTLESAGIFLNYYEKDLIQECECGNDFYFDIIK